MVRSFGKKKNSLCSIAGQYWKNTRKNTVSNKQLKKAQDEQILKPEILLLESFFFFFFLRTKHLHKCYAPDITLFSKPPDHPHPCEHAVCSPAGCLGATQTGARPRDICKSLVTSATPTTIVLFSLGILWHTKSRMSIPEHFLPVKGRFVFFVKQRKAWN